MTGSILSEHNGVRQVEIARKYILAVTMELSATDSEYKRNA